MTYEPAKTTAEKTPRVVTYIAVVASVAALFTGILAVVVTHNLRSNLIKVCQGSRTPLQERFQFELTQSEAQSIEQLQQAFPQFPADQIRDSIRGERENLRNLLATYDPAKCESQY